MFSAVCWDASVYSECFYGYDSAKVVSQSDKLLSAQGTTIFAGFVSPYAKEALNPILSIFLQQVKYYLLISLPPNPYSEKLLLLLWKNTGLRTHDTVWAAVYFDIFTHCCVLIHGSWQLMARCITGMCLLCCACPDLNPVLYSWYLPEQERAR